MGKSGWVNMHMEDIINIFFVFTGYLNMLTRIWLQHSQSHTNIQTTFFSFFYPDASSAAESDVFGLNGQIEHKLAFFRKHIPKETRLVLVGHSIGCYIILEMIKRCPELKVQSFLYSLSFWLNKQNACPLHGTVRRSY